MDSILVVLSYKNDAISFGLPGKYTRVSGHGNVLHLIIELGQV